VVVSLGLLIVVRIVAQDVMDDCRKRAGEAFAAGKRVSVTAAAIVILIWIAALALVGTVIVRLLR
jgi:hypothetical protein